MRRLPKTISHKEFLEIINNINENEVVGLPRLKLKLAFMLGFYQCLRISEVVHLIPDDVDMERGMLHIRQGKGQKDRDVPIMPPVVRGLRKLPIECSVRTLQRAIKRVSIRVIGKDIHFHTLRHSGATFYLNEKRVDIRQIQTLLGHSRISTTEIFTHVSPSALKKVFDKVWEEE